jgi:IS5 family transposase
MKQQSLAASSFEKYRKKTRKEVFLEQMNTLLPWVELCQAIEPFYLKTSPLGGRPAIGIERMLRIHFLQHWFELMVTRLIRGKKRN